MNSLQIFNSNIFGSIRMINISGKPYAVAKDVAEALGYKKPQNAISTHCKGALKQGIPTNSGIQQMLVIPQGDIVRLASKCKLPGADEFESWIFDEVIPSVINIGGYIAVKEDDSEEDILAKAILVAHKQIEKKNAMIHEQQQKLQIQLPKVLFADSVAASNTSILVGELAKILKQNGIETGQKNRCINRRHVGWIHDCNF